MEIRGNTVAIRPVSGAESEQVYLVYCGCEDFLALGPEPRASLAMVIDDIEKEQEEDGVFCGIYVSSGEMVGVVAFVPHFFKGVESQAAISLLMITARERSKGFGAEVVRLVEGYISSDPSVQTIASAVQVNNPAAILFWERMGYQIVSGPHRQPDRTVTYELQKTLRRSVNTG